LKRPVEGGQDSSAVAASSGVAYWVGGVVKVEGHGGEAGRRGAPVLTHLAHGFRVADAGRGFGNSIHVVATDCRDDALDRGKVLTHVLLLVLSHHRREGKRLPRVGCVLGHHRVLLGSGPYADE
jgi:hypothetical protein